MDSLIIFGAKYLFIALPLIFILALYQAGRPDRKRLIAAIAIALIVAGILDKIASKLYYDPRPFITHPNIKPLLNHAADNGFPSEHTLFSFTFASLIFLFRRRLGGLALGLALIVGICRVAAHVHSPIDIIGGIIIGLTAGYAGKAIAGYLLDRD
ncbi:MAG TPA: phosphatase PAP2 family protein [Candidatus Saccharimonadales bacterium]|nr:phosphatase PAP2 family protein [Candidatus Saccharimonadales bacterium]